MPCDHLGVVPGHYQHIRKCEQAKQIQPENARIYRLTHPLGEYVLDRGRSASTPSATLHFSYAQWLEARNPRISVIEQLLGKQGWLQLNLLELDSFQREEHLVFTAMTDSGELLDQEACEKLFQLCAHVEPTQISPPDDLHGNARRQIDAALSQALEQNDKFFQQERDKLDAWAEDRILAAEQALQDTKLKLKGLKRQARVAQSMDEARRLQDDIRKVEGEQRRQRQEIFSVEDEIEARRDALIEALEKRLHRASRTQTLFTMRWAVI